MLKFDKSNLKSTKVGNVVTLQYTDENVFKNGTDISFKTLKEVDDYKSQYIEQATEFAAKHAKDLMLKDKNTEKVIFEIPFSTSKRGELNVSVDRSKTYPGMYDSKTNKQLPPTTKSKITVTVKEPTLKVNKNNVKALEAELTSALVK